MRWFRQIYNIRFVASLVLMISIITLLWYAGEIRSQSDEISAQSAAMNRQAAALERQNKQLVGLAQTNRQALELIQSCTTPTGKCSREATARTQTGLIGQPAGPINDVVLVIAACQQEVQGEAALQSCAVRKLRARLLARATPSTQGRPR